MHTHEAALTRAREGNGQVVGAVADAGTGKKAGSYKSTPTRRSRPDSRDRAPCAVCATKGPLQGPAMLADEVRSF